MITLEPIPTPKDIYKNLYRIVRCHCSSYDLYKKLSCNPVTPTKTQRNISETIQDFTHNYIPSCYPSSFAKQLRVYMYAYRHHRLGGVSTV